MVKISKVAKRLSRVYPYPDTLIQQVVDFSSHPKRTNQVSGEVFVVSVLNLALAMDIPVQDVMSDLQKRAGEVAK